MKDDTLKKVRSDILVNHITDKDKEVINSLFFSYPEIYPKNIDYIIVLGNRNLYRIKKAVMLYYSRPCKMILSGGSLLKNGMKEGEYFYNYALSKGISSSDLILEKDSKNTIENIRYSFQLLNQNQNTNLLIISSTQHLYRVKKIVSYISKQLNFYPKCYYYPVFPKNYTVDRWYHYENIRKDIASELDKIVHYELLTDKKTSKTGKNVV